VLVKFRDCATSENIAANKNFYKLKKFAIHNNVFVLTETNQATITLYCHVTIRTLRIFSER